MSRQDDLWTKDPMPIWKKILIVAIILFIAWVIGIKVEYADKPVGEVPYQVLWFM